MSPSSSSTRKAAKLAQKGRGRKVRFQGGTLFPLVVAIVIVLGLGTIVYARQSQPAADASPPTVNDHWHQAYGFYLCDDEGNLDWHQLSGALEEPGTAGYQRWIQTGIHSHDDGVIHWHPYTSRAVGKRAKLSVFLDMYQVELDQNSLQFPDNQVGGATYEEGETKCGTEDGELQIVVWENFTDTDDGTTYITSFDDIRVDADGMVFSIAFAPRDTDIPMPPWAADLPALGAVDTGQPFPTSTSTVPGDTTANSTEGSTADTTVTTTGDTTADTATADTTGATTADTTADTTTATTGG